MELGGGDDGDDDAVYKEVKIRWTEVGDEEAVNGRDVGDNEFGEKWKK